MSLPGRAEQERPGLDTATGDDARRWLDWPTMLTALRQTRLPLRLLWLSALLLACVFQPALMLAGEAHEAAHALAAGGAHSDAHAEHAEHAHPAGPDAAPSFSEADGGWGALLHAAHCCAHPSAMPLAMPEMPAPAVAAGPRPARAPAPASIGSAPLLRPPIRV